MTHILNEQGEDEKDVHSFPFLSCHSSLEAMLEEAVLCFSLVVGKGHQTQLSSLALKGEWSHIIVSTTRPRVVMDLFSTAIFLRNMIVCLCT